jgi:hypothetical protein
MNYTFHHGADLVVTGQDDEAADYDNPRGLLYGYTSFVVATDETGARVRLPVVTKYSVQDALAPAEKLAAALTARFENHGKLPVAFSTWEETFPAYGSDAYSEADTIEWERSLED